jgi:hypothetical protein
VDQHGVERVVDGYTDIWRSLVDLGGSVLGGERRRSTVEEQERIADAERVYAALQTLAAVSTRGNEALARIARMPQRQDPDGRRILSNVACVSVVCTPNSRARRRGMCLVSCIRDPETTRQSIFLQRG